MLKMFTSSSRHANLLSNSISATNSKDHLKSLPSRLHTSFSFSEMLGSRTVPRKSGISYNCVEAWRVVSYLFRSHFDTCTKSQDSFGISHDHIPDRVTELLEDILAQLEERSRLLRDMPQRPPSERITACDTFCHIFLRFPIANSSFFSQKARLSLQQCQSCLHDRMTQWNLVLLPFTDLLTFFVNLLIGVLGGLCLP